MFFDIGTAERLRENMEKIIKNEKQLTEYMDSQASVINATSDLVRITTEEVNKNFERVTSEMNKIQNTLKDHFYVYSEAIKFFMLLNQVRNWVDDAEKLQSAAIALVTDVNLGKVHPALIDPKKMVAELDKIQNKLKRDQLLPGGRSPSRLQLAYKLMKAQAIFNENVLLVDARLPIYVNQHASLFNVIPVPLQIKDRKWIPKIKTESLIYSTELNAYHPMTEGEVNRCQQENEDTWLCEGSWAWKDADDHSCEISPIKPNNKQSCEMDEFTEDMYYKRLNGRNRWLIKTFKNTSAHMACGDNHEVVKLPSLGIINVPGGCTARIADITIISPEIITSTDTVTFSPHILKVLDDAETWVPTPIHHVVVNNSIELYHVRKSLKELEGKRVRIEDLVFHTANGHISLGLVTIVIAGIFIYYKKKRNQRRELMAVVFPGPPQNVQAPA